LKIKKLKIMKSGKIILGAVALIVTAGSAIAMKTNNRGLHQLFTKTKVNGITRCNAKNCYTKATPGIGTCPLPAATSVYTKVACTKTWTGGRTATL
jgi:hypothetical protein